jgi:hypothetical protein
MITQVYIKPEKMNQFYNEMARLKYKIENVVEMKANECLMFIVDGNRETILEAGFKLMLSEKGLGIYDTARNI